MTSFIFFFIDDISSMVLIVPSQTTDMSSQRVAYTTFAI
nr:MAG TPA: hypothetical protein [Caudoviricetes sp.]